MSKKGEMKHGAKQQSLSSPRYAILFEGNFNHLYGKTGNALLRYCSKDVVCCIDSENSGKTANDVVGVGGDIPVVRDIKQSLLCKPDTLLIGIATQGGYLPDALRQHICDAMENGLNIVSGLHQFISEDIEFNFLAEKHSVTIRDLRKPPLPLPFTKGSWKGRKTPVLLSVAGDCDMGKMTASWELKNGLIARDVNAKFIGTGQTGILLGNSGIAVDAVISDFTAGVIEAEIDKISNDCDLVIVEGQGSITHMAYSGVTLGLLHGAMPDMLLMCHEPIRNVDTFGHPMYDIQKTLDLYLQLVRIFKPCECVGLSLITFKESVDSAKQSIRNYEDSFKLPANDPVRFGMDNIVEHVLNRLG